MEIEEAAGEAGGVESGAEFHRRRRRRERLLGLILLGCLLASFGRAAHSAQAPPRDEYQVKAAFLFNFAKFVEWPTEAFPDGAAPLRAPPALRKRGSPASQARCAPPYQERSVILAKLSRPANAPRSPRPAASFRPAP